MAKPKKKSIPNDQQILFLNNYLDRSSPTFGNAYQSALSAGYSDEYAQVMTARGNKWLSENVSDDKNLSKAKANVSEFLHHKQPGYKLDMTKFVLQHRDKDYSPPPQKFSYEDFPEEQLDTLVKRAEDRVLKALGRKGTPDKA